MILIHFGSIAFVLTLMNRSIVEAHDPRSHRRISVVALTHTHESLHPQKMF
jgi:hypothetical protein